MPKQYLLLINGPNISRLLLLFVEIFLLSFINKKLYTEYPSHLAVSSIY